jgi:hypothetical protein
MNIARPFAILTAVLALVIGTPLLVVTAHGVESDLTGELVDETSHDVMPQTPPDDGERAVEAEATIPFEIFRGEAGLSF